jgi:hypothetical protein
MPYGRFLLRRRVLSRDTCVTRTRTVVAPAARTAAQRFRHLQPSTVMGRAGGDGCPPPILTKTLQPTLR